ncbi:MAG TPA: hypothetical protein DCL77_04285 [Prolixibacteraceae bacterium]|jgi:hypothetical protein|nr:hypothetical protein [Prolixibacteraceae bacterium]
MNHFFKILLILSSTFAFFSCSDEFVNDKLTISGVAASAIIISPEWEADDYEFKCEGVGNADFTITSQPEWLILDSNSGKFTDSIATIHGSANPEPRFSKIGFYVDQMIINASGKQYAVPVYYITEGNPSVQVDRTFEIASTNYSNVLQISNSGDGVLLWDILSMPDWLTVNMSQFSPTSLILGKGAAASVPFTFNVQAAVQNNLKGTIVLKTNDKNNPLVEIAVSAKLGTPELYFYDTNIDFGSSETTKTSRIYNQGNGILVWSFEGLPEWLSVSTASGIVLPYSTSNDFTFTCNRSMLQPGLNSATFYLKTNDSDESSVAVTVSIRVPGSGLNIKAIEGNIVDATFDKNTNTLYYVTGLPNKLVAYDVTAKTILHEVALSKAPTCLAIDEDFKQALVGHGGSISTVDLTSFLVGKTYPLNSTVYDVEWAKDSWFCYTIADSYSSNLLWINSTTGATYQTPQAPFNYSLGTANLRKIPNQPYIIASRTNVSPTGIFVFDLDTKALKSYTHTSIGNPWFFKQGELMVTGYSSIIRTSVVVAASGNSIDSPSSIGELKIGQYTTVSWWIDYCAANHSIWAIFSYYPQTYYAPVKGTIYQFEDNDYSLVKTYAYDYMYQPVAQTAAYEVEARYVFSNSSGTELSVLRKRVDNTTWSVEFIPVQ